MVEDESGIADFVSRGLVRHGFEVQVAQTAGEAVECVDVSRPDLVVLDLMLPDADGIEVCKWLRATGDIGILILTARHLVGDRVRGLEAGADDYLPKPFDFQELLARIRAILRRHPRLSQGVTFLEK